MMMVLFNFLNRLLPHTTKVVEVVKLPQNPYYSGIEKNSIIQVPNGK